MEENNTQDFQYQITDILPKYTKIDEIYQSILKYKVLYFEDQQQIFTFYNQFRNLENFEKAVLNFITSKEKEKQLQFFSILRKVIKKNIEKYNDNRNFLDSIDTFEICWDRANSVESKIKIQEKHANNQYIELRYTENSLESASWKGDDERVRELEEKVNKFSDLYKIEQEKLETLHREKEKLHNESLKFADNVFGKIYELESSFLLVLNNYFFDEWSLDSEQNSEPKKREYFDMQLILSIHKECNGVQFENLNVIDFYNILNLQPTTTKLIIKNREKERMYHLISNLYSCLQSDNNKEWRTALLNKLGIKWKIYNSKYKTVSVSSEEGNKKNKKFKDVIESIFNNIF